MKIENNQYKKLNEKLFDRIDMLQALIEKEASANQYMYNYPPKPGEGLTLEQDDDKGKKGDDGPATAGDKEQGKIKKQYEDLIESNRKNFEATIKQEKTGSASEIEMLTLMFSKTSRTLISTTISNREL